MKGSRSSPSSSAPGTEPKSVLSRRGFLIGLGALPLARHPVAERPNILFIIDDQHNRRALGYAGGPVHTPALDALAAESSAFTQAYCASPVCGPARASIATGRFPTAHGVHANGVPMNEGVPSFIERLQAAGYTTASVGKLHHSPFHVRGGFEYVLHHESGAGPAGISHYWPFLQRELKARGIKPPAADVEMQLQSGIDWIPEDITPAAWVTDQSLGFLGAHLKRPTGKPFFLHASYVAPHHPYMPRPEYARSYRPEDVLLPPNYDVAGAAEWWRLRGRPNAASPYEVQRLRARYFAFVAQLDAQIGRLLAGVDGLGLRRSTLVIFTSDHGDLIGEHGRFFKGTMHEGSVGVPLLVRDPRSPGAFVNPTPVSHVDLAPAILSAAGVGATVGVGADMTPFTLRREICADREVYAELLGRAPFVHLMLRRGALKVRVSCVGKERSRVWAMHDLDNDPWEMRDLSSDPSHRAAYEEMKRALLDRWSLQARHLTETRPALRPLRYDLSWPADGWKQVLPQAIGKAPTSGSGADDIGP